MMDPADWTYANAEVVMLVIAGITALVVAFAVEGRQRRQDRRRLAERQNRRF